MRIDIKSYRLNLHPPGSYFLNAGAAQWRKFTPLSADHVALRLSRPIIHFTIQLLRFPLSLQGPYIIFIVIESCRLTGTGMGPHLANKRNFKV